METKKCSKCHTEKPLSMFSKCSRNKDGLRFSCKECQKKYYSQNSEKIKSKSKKYYHDNIEKENSVENAEELKEYQKKYRNKPENKTKANSYSKEYYKNNKLKINKTKKSWNKKNKDKINKRNRERKIQDINFKLRSNLRSRFNVAIKRKWKKTSVIELTGCSIDELKIHIEKQFSEGMNWKNWSKEGWHIDHIKPLSLFDLTNIKEQKKAFHYTNLQPLWAKDNIIKSNKY